MRILLPGDADRVAMTKQTFIAMNVFGDRFAHMIAAPGSGIDNGLLLTGDTRCECHEKNCDCKKSKRTHRRGSIRFHFNRERHCYHLSVPLKLRPDSITPRPWQESFKRNSVSNRLRRMRMNIVSRIFRKNQRMAPGAEIWFEVAHRCTGFRICDLVSES